MRAPRTEPNPEFTTQSLVWLDNYVHVFAILLDDVVHRRGIPGRGLGWLLLAQVNTKLVFSGRSAALLVGRPSVSLVAAADDAVVADDVEFLGILRDDWKLIDLTLVGHCFLPNRTLDSRPTEARRRAGRTAGDFAWLGPKSVGRLLHSRTGNND